MTMLNAITHSRLSRASTASIVIVVFFAGLLLYMADHTVGLVVMLSAFLLRVGFAVIRAHRRHAGFENEKAPAQE